MSKEIDEFVDYALEKVGNPYLWGGNGETLEDIVTKHADSKGQKREDTKRMLNFLHTIGLFNYSFQDCSGLVVSYMLPKKLIKSDMTANDFYNKCKKVSRATKGALCFLLRKDGTAYHVGICTSNKNVVHALNQDVGVIYEEISKRNWVFGLPEFAFNFDAPDVGDTVVLKKPVTVYTSSADAKAHNSTAKHVKYNAGTYFVYRTFGDCTNITRTIGVAGGWIYNKDLEESTNG